MRILIFEPSHGGHRLSYVRHITLALLEVASDITLALGRQAPDSAQYAEQICGLEDRVKLDPFLKEPQGSRLAIATGNARALQAAIDRHRPEHLYAPYADGLSQILGARRWAGRGVRKGGAEAEALMMRGAFAYPKQPPPAWLRRRLWLACTAAAPWDLIHHVDPLVFDAVQRRGGPLARRLRLIPDPVPPPRDADRRQARRRLGVPEDGRYIGCAGAIDVRKGCNFLVHAFAHVKLPPTDRLLLVGPCDQPLRGMWTRSPYQELVRQGRIIVMDRYVSEADLDTTFDALDVVAPLYPVHIGSGSIVIRAAAARRPVLGYDWGWTAYVVRRFGLGWLSESLDAEPLGAAIARSLEQAGDYRPGRAAELFALYHSIPNFAGHWMVRLRERLGRPAAAGLIPWEQVLRAADEEGRA